MSEWPVDFLYLLFVFRQYFLHFDIVAMVATEILAVHLSRMPKDKLVKSQIDCINGIIDKALIFVAEDADTNDHFQELIPL